MEPTQVQVGNATYTLEAWRGIKGLLAGQLVARIARQWPGLADEWATYTNTYRENHKLKVTRETARIEREKAAAEEREPRIPYTDADFDRRETDTIELALDPPFGAAVIAVFPSAFGVVETELVGLLALFVIELEDLRVAWEQGPEQVDQALHKRGTRLLFEADMDQLAELAFAGGELIQNQFSGQSDRLGKLLRRFLPGMQQQTEQTEEDGQTQPTERPAVSDTKRPKKKVGSVVRTDSEGSQDQESAAQPTTKRQKQGSSTPSPQPMAGSANTRYSPAAGTS